MSSRRALSPVLLASMCLLSCRRDPNVAKQKYLESGMGFVKHGSYRNAVIQFANAIKIDPRFGPAHYQLALVSLKLTPPNLGAAAREFRRSVELLRDNQAYQREYLDSMVELADMYIIYAPKQKGVMQDAQQYSDELLKRNPNSFDGLRLSADIKFNQGVQAEDNPAAAAALFDQALDLYHRADAVQPHEPGVSMQIGLLLLERKQYSEAEPYFRNVIEKKKDYEPGYVNLYKAYMLQQKTGDAEALLQQAVRNNPTNPAFASRLAAFYLATGRRQEMLNVLAQLESRSKDIAMVYRVVGDFYARTGDPDAAIREYRTGIVKDNAKNKNLYEHAIIEVLLRQNKRAEAAEINKQILKENPKDPDAKSLAATFLLEQGDIDNAITQLSSVVTNTPDNATAHYQLGRAYRASTRSDAQELARQEFEKALALQQNLILPRLELAGLQVDRGEYDAALDSVQEVLKRDPNNLAAKLIQSQAYLGQKKYGDSDILLDTLLKKNPGSAAVYYQAGKAALAQNRPADAEKAFLHAYELDHRDVQSIGGVVDCEIRMGHPEKAMAFLQTESNRTPNRLDLTFLMGRTAQSQGKLADSLSYFNKVLNGLKPKSKTRADLYLNIAESYRREGDLNNSLANLQKARDILPENEQVLRDIGVISQDAGRRSEARQAFEACLHVNPNNVEVLNDAAYLMAETNTDLDTALNYAQKAKGLAPNAPAVTDTYAWVLFKKGLYAQALTVLQGLVKQVPTRSTYHFHLAKVYSQQGENAKASAELREALRYNPSKEEQQDIRDMLSRMGKG